MNHMISTTDDQLFGIERVSKDPSNCDSMDEPSGLSSVCEICFGKHPSSQVRVCKKCRLRVCTGCNAEWLRNRITGGYATTLSCVQCNEKFTDAEVLQLCPDLYKKYLYFRSKQEHRTNPLAEWCPNDGCYRLLLDVRQQISPGQKEVSCPDCGIKLCTECFSIAHDGGTCVVPHDGLFASSHAACWKKTHTKKCPTCHVRIQKSGGCSKVRCTSCQTRFCWICCGLVHDPRGLAPRNPNARVCKGRHVTTIMENAALFGGLVITVPLVLGAAAVIVPPTVLVFIALPKHKKESVRVKFFDFVDRLADDYHDVD